ncbi:MAG: DUF2807 domain-containing protein [Flavobacteriales bacterium CG03_land_8_20_14_0_80_35_15]|nr:MAG: DUF2807 domain-containing protein [Flavobacteriales bacterium CG03_land_8_20_14_0_80_35_15]
MKTNYKIGGLLLLLLVSTTSCMLNGLSGNGQVQTEPRSIRQEFKALSVSQGIDVYLTTNQSNSVKVEADDNILDLIKTEVQNGTLKIYLSKQVWHSKARKVYVSAPIIEEILVSSGASVKLENTLIVDKLMLKASSGSEIEVHVGVSDLYCEASSGADITLIGTAKNLDVEASSGSSVKADDLKTYDTNAKATSGATVNVNATNTIQIKKGSGGSVNYKGSPKIL